MNDYIKLNRCIKHNWLWTDDEPFDKRSAWIDLLLLASWKDEKKLYGNKLSVFKRGTVHKSMSELASRWHWHRTTVSRFLKLLESDEMVKVDATTHGTTITVINWDLYQCDSTTNATTDARPMHDRCTTDARPMHTIEESKESKEGKEGKNNIPPYSPPKGKTTKERKAEKNINLFNAMSVGYEFSDEMTAKVTDWLKYKGQEKGFEYKEVGLKALLSQIRQNAEMHGDRAVVNCIDLSMSNGYQGILWDKLQSNRGGYSQTSSFMDIIRDDIYGGG